jgi:hypothetical protein
MKPIRTANGIAFVLALALQAATVRAASKGWIGSADLAYANGANSVGGVAPTNNDWVDVALFTADFPIPSPAPRR